MEIKELCLTEISSVQKVRYRSGQRHGPTNAYAVYHGAESIMTCSKAAESSSEQSCFTARILVARRGEANRARIGGGCIPRPQKSIVDFNKRAVQWP